MQLATLSILLSPCTSFAQTQHLLLDKKKKIFPVGKRSISQIDEDSQVKDYLIKIRHPDQPHQNDVILGSDYTTPLRNVVLRMRRLCETVGYGNFGILGFDDAVRFARKSPAIEPFSSEELEFLDKIYHKEAQEYGFLGEKQITNLHQNIDHKSIVKIPGNGNYLFKGKSIEKYNTIKADLGEEVLLTSGIRGLVKQFYLFLNKADRYAGNLSLASRSLAPPGYSYHANGDFDIGQVGLGAQNFSEHFIATSVYKKLTEQGYVEYRYEKDNMLGVRYEPWHIKL